MLNRSESKYFNTAIRFDKTLLSLLEKKTFEYISISEVCEAAGVNRSTFYLHYENLCDLLEETTRYLIEDFFHVSQLIIKALHPNLQNAIYRT